MNLINPHQTTESEAITSIMVIVHEDFKKAVDPIRDALAQLGFSTNIYSEENKTLIALQPISSPLDLKKINAAITAIKESAFPEGIEEIDNKAARFESSGPSEDGRVRIVISEPS